MTNMSLSKDREKSKWCMTLQWLSSSCTTEYYIINTLSFRTFPNLKRMSSVQATTMICRQTVSIYRKGHGRDLPIGGSCISVPADFASLIWTSHHTFTHTSGAPAVCAIPLFNWQINSYWQQPAAGVYTKFKIFMQKHCFFHTLFRNAPFLERQLQCHSEQNVRFPEILEPKAEKGPILSVQNYTYSLVRPFCCSAMNMRKMLTFHYFSNATA